MRSRHSSTAITVAIVFSFAHAAPIAEQAGGQPRAPRVEVGPYVGVALNSPVGTHLGVIPDRNHVFVGLEATVSLVGTRVWRLAYAPQLVPLLLVTNNPTYRTVSTINGLRLTFEDGRAPVIGFGVSPIGFETRVRVRSRWGIYVAGAAGVVWFGREVPVAYSRAFNYTFEFGGGVGWQYSSKDALRFGYKFHHLSNAYSALTNPGLDAAVFLVGYQRAIGSRHK